VWLSASTSIASLFGQGRGDDAAQIPSDLNRLSILFGFVTSGILIPIVKPLLRWVDTPEDIVQLSFQFFATLTAGCFITCWYCTMSGVLQSEGRTLLCGAINIGCLVLNMALFNPLYLLLFKVGIMGAALSTISSEFATMLLLELLYYSGKFGVKPLWSGLCMKFSPETWPAVKIGVSQFISNMAGSFPAFFLRKFMSMGTADSDEFAWILSGFNAAIRFNNFSWFVLLGLNTALIPLVSYAYAAKLYGRCMRLIMWAALLMFSWSTVCWIVTTFFNKQICLMFGDEPEYIEASSKMIYYVGLLAPLTFFRLEARAILQAMKFGTRATILSFSTDFVALFGVVTLLYYTRKNDPKRLCLAFPISQVLGSLMSFGFLWTPVKGLFVSMKKEDQQGEAGLDDLDESAIAKKPESAESAEEAVKAKEAGKKGIEVAQEAVEEQKALAESGHSTFG
jgi:Na+-driven multidrug efflux pump